MDHTRENRSLLAAAERRLLIRIARRLPPWINSDHLTMMALLAMSLAGLAFAALARTRWRAAVIVLALAANWCGDSLDGTVARVRGHLRPRYGYYVDHIVDLAGTAALVAGIAVSGAMTPWIAFALLAAYCLVSAETYLATHAVGVFRISFAGFGPTELRLVLATGSIAVATDPWIGIAGRRILLFDVGGLVAIAGLVGVFAISATRNARALFRAEPLPRGAPTSTVTAATDPEHRTCAQGSSPCALDPLDGE